MWYLIAAGAALALVLLYFFMIFPAKAPVTVKRRYEGRSFAHRGLYKNGTPVPENSLAAFRLAVKHSVGAELDVQLSSDGQLVVFHDDNLKRACGVDKNVWELSFEQLRQLRLFGTNETIPLFSEVLEIFEKSRQPLIVELKSVPKHKKLNDECCKKTWELLRAYRGDWCVESFDPLMMRWFKKQAPTAVRGQLANPAKDYDSGGGIIRFMLANLLLNFFSRPHFIAYSLSGKRGAIKLPKALGAFIVAWTCRDEGEHLTLACEGEGVIFEGYLAPPNE